MKTKKEAVFEADNTVLVAESQESVDAFYSISPQERRVLDLIRAAKQATA